MLRMIPFNLASTCRPRPSNRCGWTARSEQVGGGYCWWVSCKTMSWSIECCGTTQTRFVRACEALHFHRACVHDVNTNAPLHASTTNGRSSVPSPGPTRRRHPHLRPVKQADIERVTNETRPQQHGPRRGRTLNERGISQFLIVPTMNDATHLGRAKHHASCLERSRGVGCGRHVGPLDERLGTVFDEVLCIHQRHFVLSRARDGNVARELPWLAAGDVPSPRHIQTLCNDDIRRHHRTTSPPLPPPTTTATAANVSTAAATPRTRTTRTTTRTRTRTTRTRTRTTTTTTTTTTNLANNKHSVVDRTLVCVFAGLCIPILPLNPLKATCRNWNP